MARECGIGADAPAHVRPVDRHGMGPFPQPADLGRRAPGVVGLRDWKFPFAPRAMGAGETFSLAAARERIPNFRSVRRPPGWSGFLFQILLTSGSLEVPEILRLDSGG